MYPEEKIESGHGAKIPGENRQGTLGWSFNNIKIVLIKPTGK